MAVDQALNFESQFTWCFRESFERSSFRGSGIIRKSCVRMDREYFKQLLNKVTSLILTKTRCKYEAIFESLSSKLKLETTLQLLS